MLRRRLLPLLLSAGFLATAAPAWGAGVVGDDFSGSSLDTSTWSFVNPVGDAGVTVGSGHATISIPAGADHDLWTGANRAPRLLQSVSDADFNVEAKFDSAVTQRYQSEGIVVQQDADDLLRFEVHSDGSTAHLFAASMTGGVATTEHYSTVAGGAPVYLRLQRSGSTWTLRYSNDGATWTSATITHALAVSRIGPFASTSGPLPPAFSASIDYFRPVAPDTTPPAISAVASSPGDLAAKITWSTDEPSTSTVAYGPASTYGSTASAGGLVRSHSVTLSGLACGHTYHFQARSTDEAGNEARAPDATFATTACPAAIRSDEFGSPSLNTGIWTFVDPVGDAGVSMSGTQAVITVPGGVSHDLWTGANDAPRLLQAAPDADFKVDAKFDSAVTQRYQTQGIVVEQDADHLLRFDVHSDGTAASLFVAALDGGQATTLYQGAAAGGAPTYLRVRRTGDTWTLWSSPDGNDWTLATSFTRAMTMTAIGPFAANSGGLAPAFAAKVDYFRLIAPDTTPPVISSVAAAPGPVSGTVTWTTDEPATSKVVYGADTTYGQSASDQALVRNHSVTLTDLACGRAYHFQVRSTDDSGNQAVSNDATFQAPACPAALSSDEFDGSTLDTSRWTLVDPVGDARAAAGGGDATITVPPGRDHDLWPGANNAPRLLQPAPDDDFTVELKFDSTVSARYQSQGLVVRQDADDLLRMDVYSDGTNAHLFAAVLNGGTATVEHDSTVPSGGPVYLRLRRAGDDWTLRYSTDGQDWGTSVKFTQALKVTAVGPFAGSSGGSPPGLTAAVDYFRVVPPDKTPPALSAIAVAPAAISAQVTWTTDEPSTSAVDFGQASTGEHTASDADLTRQHSLALHGLACGQAYRFRVRSADESGNVATSTEATFATKSCPDAIVSDEFDAATLDTGLWAFDDPVGDASVSQGNGVVAISVPGGVDHDLWTGANRAPRLLQPAPDKDFQVQVKFTTAVSQRYQMEGVVVEQAPDDLLRLEVHYDGSATRLFAASISGGAASTKYLAAVPGGAPAFLRVTRNGDRWTLEYSTDGSEWTAAATFTFDMTVTAVGPFAANSGGTPPAFTAKVDYFRLVPPPPPDVTPPAISGVAATARAASARIAWSTDEPATSRVEWGATTAYGRTPVTAQELITDHALPLKGLDCGTTYHYRVGSTDAAGNAAVSGDRTFTTSPCTPPDIDVWYGSQQRFGQNGHQLRWINILGHASDPDGIAWVDYSLNGAPSQPLVINPDNNLRIVDFGDFNAEIDVNDLHAGANTVQLIASDRIGTIARRTVTVDYTPGVVAPLPYVADWGAVQKIEDTGQVLDGLWTIQNGTIRPDEAGYDRIVDVGDMSWKNYEVTVPITIHSISSVSPHAGVGLAVGWQGHEGTARPRLDWPIGGMCFYYRDRVVDPYQLWMPVWPAPHFLVNDGTENSLRWGVTYNWKLRTQSLPDQPGMARYSCKVWRAGTTEPTAWNATMDRAERPGSVILVADYTDASFGRTEVRPLAP